MIMKTGKYVITKDGRIICKCTTYAFAKNEWEKAKNNRMPGEHIIFHGVFGDILEEIRK